MKINKKVIKDVLFQSSYLLSFLASWIVVEVFMSMNSWWYRHDPIGTQIIGIFAFSTPLYFISSILRKFTSPNIEISVIKKYGDIIISVLGIFIILLPITNDVMSLVILAIIALSSIITHPVMEFLNLKRSWVYLLHPTCALIVVGVIYKCIY